MNILFYIVLIIAIISIIKIAKVCHGNLTDKIFLITFIAILFIPMSKIDTSKYNMQEKRKLTTLDKIEDFEEFINDRFYGRNTLLRLNTEILYYIAIRYPHIHNRIVDKKTNFLYRYAQSPVYKEQMSPHKYKKFVKEIQSGINALQTFCNQNNIKLYVLILPEKESVHHPHIILNNNDKQIKNFINDIKHGNKTNIIFPLKELQQEAQKGEYVFYKTDHHLTNTGYYIAYSELMGNINKDFPKIYIEPQKNFDIILNKKVKSGVTFVYGLGEVCSTIGIPDYICEKHHDTEYKYFVHKNKNTLNVKKINTPLISSSGFFYPEGKRLKVILIGNSHIEGLCEIIPYSFKTLIKIRLNGPQGILRKDQYKILKYYKEWFIKYKPNIIILCIGYDVIKYLPDINK